MRLLVVMPISFGDLNMSSLLPLCSAQKGCFPSMTSLHVLKDRYLSSQARAFGAGGGPVYGQKTTDPRPDAGLLIDGHIVHQDGQSTYRNRRCAQCDSERQQRPNYPAHLLKES